MKQTAWEKIYAQYKKTGKKWASLENPIHTSFPLFLEKARFAAKTALDLGCGNGKYLKFLQDIGFSVAGIDSSPTAIKLAKQTLGKKASLRIADIYTAKIPIKKYNLIISIATVQHALKGANEKLVNKIYKSLPLNGCIFITFPRMNSVRRWATFKGAEQIEPGTFVPFMGPEKGLPHSFYKKDELVRLFANFRKSKIVMDDRGRWIVTASR